MKKYALVGTGSRSAMFYEAIATTYKETCQVVGLCDQSETRMNYANKVLTELGHNKVPMYGYTMFEQMLDDTKPDVVIVTSTDRTHHDILFVLWKRAVM